MRLYALALKFSELNAVCKISSKSPAAKLADVVLRCGSNEGPFQLGSVAAKIAQLVVVDMLFQEYFSRNREICEENIQSIASALSDMHI